MANACQTHGKRMAIAWQTHGKRMANVRHSKRMAQDPPKGYPRISKGFQGPPTEPHGIPRAGLGKPQGSSGACLCFVLVQRHACPCTLNGVTQTRFPFTRLDRFFLSVYTCFYVFQRLRATLGESEASGVHFTRVFTCVQHSRPSETRVFTCSGASSSSKRLLGCSF